MRLTLSSEESRTNKALYWLKLGSTGCSCLSLSVTFCEFSRRIGHITAYWQGASL